MSILKAFRRTPVRTFFLYPVIVLAWELSISRGTLNLNPIFLTLMLWGYLQYRLCGMYRVKHGGGGPGLETPPDRLVSNGPYAYSRNPMYLGHIIFLIGLTLALHSLLAGLVAIATAVWFHLRVLADEKHLAARLGEPYVNYLAEVKRWIPGLF